MGEDGGLLEADEIFYERFGEPLFSSHALALPTGTDDESIAASEQYFRKMAEVDLMTEVVIGGEAENVALASSYSTPNTDARPRATGARMYAIGGRAPAPPSPSVLVVSFALLLAGSVRSSTRWIDHCIGRTCGGECRSAHLWVSGGTQGFCGHRKPRRGREM